MSDASFAPLGAPPGVVDQVVERVRAKIVDGSFPPGSHVPDATIAAQMQISRGPVREALQRLIQEGLLRNVRHRGVFVTELEPADVEDIAFARMAVDRLAVGQLAQSRDVTALAELAGVVEQMRSAAGRNDWNSLMELDLRFHEILVGSLQSRRLRGFYRTLITETRMSLALQGKYYPDKYEIADEHQLLLDAIQRGDSAELDQVMAKHVDHAGRRAEFEAQRDPSRKPPISND